MKFLAITLIVHRPDPITGVRKPTHDRFREVLDNALLAEELGFDGFGVGIWRQDKVTAATCFRPGLTDAEVWPRPYQQPGRA